MKKTYRKPRVRSQRVRVGVYGEYQTQPIDALQPYFGLCCQ